MLMNKLNSYELIKNARYLSKTIRMSILRNIFGLEDIVAFSLKAVTELNSAKPTTTSEWVRTESTENGE